MGYVLLHADVTGLDDEAADAFVGAAANLGLDVIDLAADLADAEMIVLISTSLAAMTSKLAERFGAGAGEKLWVSSSDCGPGARDGMPSKTVSARLRLSSTSRPSGQARSL